MDGDGYVTLRSRRAELITVAGTPWYPRDVEEALCRRRGVRQAALVGVPDSEAGAQPTAFITLDPDAIVDPAKLLDEIAPELTYDLSRLEIRVVPELPMTPTGKISKADLLAQATKGERA
jgi:long-chain acyl-CoA synthetase